VHLTAWVIRTSPRDARIALLVDETMLHDKMRAMVVCVAHRRRTIPLAWWWYPNTQWPKLRFDDGQEMTFPKLLPRPGKRHGSRASRQDSGMAHLLHDRYPAEEPDAALVA
jgi:hypothetical protein